MFSIACLLVSEWSYKQRQIWNVNNCEDTSLNKVTVITMDGSFAELGINSCLVQQCEKLGKIVELTIAEFYSAYRINFFFLHFRVA